MKQGSDKKYRTRSKEKTALSFQAHQQSAFLAPAPSPFLVKDGELPSTSSIRLLLLLPLFRGLL